MKRPGTVWLLFFYMLLIIIVTLFGVLVQLSTSFNEENKSRYGFTTINNIFNLLLLIPGVVMITKFFMLRKSALLWVHIYFGIYILLTFIQLILSFTIGKFPIGKFPIGITLSFGFNVFFWWAVVNYINKKQIDGNPLFN